LEILDLYRLVIDAMKQQGARLSESQAQQLLQVLTRRSSGGALLARATFDWRCILPK